MTAASGRSLSREIDIGVVEVTDDSVAVAGTSLPK